MTRILLLVAGVLLGGALLTATAQDVQSGPKVGNKVADLKVYDATGENKEKSVDYAALRKDKTTVFLFISEGKFSRPMNKFMKTLDTQIEKELKGVYAVAVFVTDDEDKAKEFLPKVQT